MRILFYTSFIFSVIVGSSCNTPQATPISATVKQDYRPAYHFTADSNWINDPNGLIYHNGEYHLFFQYNPFGSKWGHMSWGHAVSNDLLSWKQLPVAIQEAKNPNDADTTMIFSGSVVLDKNNSSGFGIPPHNAPLVAIYTSNVRSPQQHKAQHQSIAYSNDNGLTWTKYEGNPVLDIQSLEFRDPKVFWYEPQQKWVMSVVKPDKHQVQLYSSKNLKEWNFMSSWGSAGNTARFWECPDLFEMTVKETNEKKWVLIVSAGHAQDGYVGMQYFTGNFDGTSFTPDHDYKQPTYFDFGKDIYAAVTYNDAPDNRRILVGWMNNWEYANEIPTGTVWRGSYTIPRELSLVKSGNEYKLMQQPVKEFTILKGEVLSLQDKTVDNVFDLSYKGESYELELLIEPAMAKVAGVKLLKGKNEETVIRYDNVLKQLQLDRTRSGNVSFHPKFKSVEKADIPLQQGLIKLNILVDNSVVTVFANDGISTITDLVFPLEKAGGIQLFSEGEKAIFKNVKIRKIRPVK